VKPPEPSFVENPDRKYWSKWHWQDVVDRWNWEGHEDQPLEVEAYCAHEEVELFLNGESLGRKETNRGTEWIARWEVPYAPGSLKAIAYQGNQEVDSWELVTASEPEKIRLTADRSRITANGQDLSYVQVELQDGKGNLNRVAADLVEFEIEGPGRIIAVASSDPVSTESFQQPRRKAFRGRCMVIIRSDNQPGEITLTAHSGNLQSGSVTVSSEF
jgi:beta-galactosidase